MVISHRRHGLAKKKNYSFLRTFGYEAFVHVDKENKTKLDAKSQKCTFIGYGIDDYGYRLWDFENMKIIKSRDVIFNEKVMYKDQLQEKKHEQVKEDYVVLDEILENEKPQEPDAQQQQENPPTPVSVRHFTQLSRPPKRFSPSLYSILLTDSSELEEYKEPMQVDTR